MKYRFDVMWGATGEYFTINTPDGMERDESRKMAWTLAWEKVTNSYNKRLCSMRGLVCFEYEGIDTHIEQDFAYQFALQVANAMFNRGEDYYPYLRGLIKMDGSRLFPDDMILSHRRGIERKI